MISPSRVKQEPFFSGDEEVDEDEEEVEGDEGNKIELLKFERNLILDTFTDDVLFILARYTFFSFLDKVVGLLSCLLSNLEGVLVSYSEISFWN